MENRKYFYVTTPIYYVNDKPHIGHFYTNLASDVLARHYRLLGYNVKFLTGTDEHGQKIAESAKKAKLSEQEFVDKISLNFKFLNETAHFSNEDFIRTTEERHKRAVQTAWKVLEEKGYIYKNNYKGWYLVKDETFVTETETIKNEDGTRTTLDGTPLILLEEENYFFKLSQMRDKLIEYYEKNPNSIKPKSRYNEIMEFIKGGLEDLSISRSSFSWGIKVPQDDKHIIYVWLDALVNYISALNYPVENINENPFWNNVLHIIGKDILRFHAVYWPSFLMALNIKPPKQIFAHGWWTNEGQKISKSLGNTIDPIELITKYGNDSVRYFLLKEITFGNDGNFSQKLLEQRVNSELANEYGNLIQRTLSIVYKNCQQTIPKMQKTQSKEGSEMIESAKNLIENSKILLNELDFNENLNNIWKIVRNANSYIDKTAPWNLQKNGKIEEMERVLYTVLETIKHINNALRPFLIDITTKVSKQLNITTAHISYEEYGKIDIGNRKIDKPNPIIEKIEIKEGE